MPRFAKDQAASDPDGWALVDVAPDGDRFLSWSE